MRVAYRFLIAWPAPGGLGWTYLDLARPVDEVHVESASIGIGYGKAGQASVEVLKSSMPDLSSMVRSMTVNRSTMVPAANTLWVIRHEDGGVPTPVFGGFIWDIAAGSSSRTVRLSAEEFPSYFDHQNLIADLTATHSAFGANLVNNIATTLATSLLISETASNPQAMAMATKVTLASTAIYTPRWYAYDNHKVGDLLGELATFADDLTTQSIVLNGSPTGGTFAVSYQGQQTANIAFNATNATVQAALVALSTIGAGGCTVTGGPGPATPWVVTFVSTSATAITATVNNLTGGTAPDIGIVQNSLGHSRGFEWKQIIEAAAANSATLQAKVGLWAPVIPTPVFSPAPVVAWGDGTGQTAREVDWLYSARAAGTRVKVAGFGERGLQTYAVRVSTNSVALDMPLLDYVHTDKKLRGQFNVNAKADQILEVLGTPQFSMKAKVVLGDSKALQWQHLQPGYRIQCHVRDAGMTFTPILRIVSVNIRIDKDGTEQVELDLAPDTSSFAS